MTAAFAGRAFPRQGRSLTFVAAADASAGTSTGWDNGGTGYGLFGTMSDTKSNILINHMKVQGFVSDTGAANFDLYLRNPGELSLALAAWAAADLFTKVTIRSGSGTSTTVIAQLLKSAAAVDTSSAVYAKYRWTATGATALVAGNTYTMDIE